MLKIKLRIFGKDNLVVSSKYFSIIKATKQIRICDLNTFVTVTSYLPNSSPRAEARDYYRLTDLWS